MQRLRGDYVYNTLDRFMRDITPEFGQRSAGGFPFIADLLSTTSTRRTNGACVRTWCLRWVFAMSKWGFQPVRILKR